MRFLIGLYFLIPLCLLANEPQTPKLGFNASKDMVIKYVGNNLGVKENYYLDVLDEAMKATEAEYGPYRLEYSEENLSSERKQDLLVTGDRINVDRLIGFHNDNAAGPYKALIKVEYELLHGFMGYRIPLIRKASQPKFHNIRTLAQLRTLSMGLAKGWEGYIYRHNGLNVSEPVDMNSLIRMLAGGRFDFIPMSAVEIEEQYTIETQQPATLMAEENLLIYYPMPTHFYVSPQFPNLAKRLNEGLEKIGNNGTESRIFNKYFAEKLKKLNLSKRNIISIKNPDDHGYLGKTNHQRILSY